MIGRIMWFSHHSLDRDTHPKVGGGVSSYGVGLLPQLSNFMVLFEYELTQSPRGLGGVGNSLMVGSSN